MLKHLGEINVFKPPALAVVSRKDEKSLVGAANAVSNFLRPLHLHKRIADFKKPSLRKAIISAFRNNRYTKLEFESKQARWHVQTCMYKLPKFGDAPTREQFLYL